MSTEKPPQIPSLPTLTLPEGWDFFTDPTLEWRPRDEQHPSNLFMKKFENTALDWNQLPVAATTVCVPVLYVSDAKGEALVDFRFEPRIVKKGLTPGQTQVVAVDSRYWILHRPSACVAFEAGDFEKAMNLSALGDTIAHRAVFLKSRERLEINEALEAFKVLFKHYSFNEELWRLERWMKDLLPFTLEDHPAMEEYRRFLTQQVGHLRGAESEINGPAIRKWYAEGSPSAEGLEASTNAVTYRHKWLIEECQRLGYKRVAEWGSVNGVSLFPLMNLAPDIEWIGFESSAEARIAGNALAHQYVSEKNPPWKNVFQLYPMTEFTERGQFDAVSLFEVLEHNDWETGIDIVTQCLSVLRVGGSLFICTPCGNWSGFDEHTRDLSLRKDHINAFTPQRMAKLLKEVTSNYGLTLELTECRREENPALKENNAWVVARIERKR